MANDHPIPDVLGYLTGGARVQAGVTQVALGVHPAFVGIGSPFEVLLLVQNASSVSVDVTATLQLPRHFVGKSARVVATVAPAEVGYIRLPAAATREASGSGKISVEVEAKPLAKPARVRDNDGGAPFTPSDLPPDRAVRMEALRGVGWSSSKALALGKTVLEAAVQVGGSGGPPRDLAAGWVSLWTLADVADDAVLLRRFGELFKYRVLPQLKADQTLSPLVEAVDQRFTRAGYTLRPTEALMVAKLMALVLEYAAPRDTKRDPLEAGTFNLEPVLNGTAQNADLPRWTRAMLRAIARDERVATHAVAALTRLLFDDLLHDAIRLGYALVETHTGEDIGTEREKADYAERLVALLGEGGGMDFVHAYMPLIIAGIIVNDRVVTRDDNIVEALRQLWVVLDERRLESDEDSQPVVDIAEQTIERALQTYGYRRGST